VDSGCVQITIDVPAALADEGTAARARVLLVLDAVRSELMTWRAAARALGLAPSAFLDLARDHGVPVSRYSATDLVEDLATLDQLASRRPTDE
jgi:predicted HTH domain antitoxin